MHVLLERFDRAVGEWVVVDAFRDPVELIDAVRAIGRTEAVVLRTRHIRTDVSGRDPRGCSPSPAPGVATGAAGGPPSHRTPPGVRVPGGTTWKERLRWTRR